MDGGCRVIKNTFGNQVLQNRADFDTGR